MGTPATPSAQDRASIRQLCADVVRSVEEDAEMPLPIGDGALVVRDDVESLVMQLAQEVCELAKEKDEAVRLLVKATHGGEITRDDTRRVSALMKVTGVEP
jgi:hypothetical protein